MCEQGSSFSFQRNFRSRSRGGWQWHNHDPMITLRFLIMVMVMPTNVWAGVLLLLSEEFEEQVKR